MILKYIGQQRKFLSKLNFGLAQFPKKRTQAPRYVKSKLNQKVDPKNVDYSVVPQQLRKGVRAHVQATNMLVTSQAQLEAMSLKQVILQQRCKFKNTLDNIGQTPAKQQSGKQTPDKRQEVQRNYDLTNALKFLSNISNTLMVANIGGYLLFHSLKKYSILGFFLGVSMNPSVITLTGLAVGFNCAVWIIRQSLHLQIRDPQQLTPQRISLTGCSTAMYFEAVAIATQAFGLSYYLMNPNPSSNYYFLVGSFVLSQTQLVYNIIKATGGYKFQFFSKLLVAQTISAILVGTMTFSLFSKIDQCNNLQEYKQATSPYETSTLDQNFQIRNGYKRFLSQFKAKDYSVIAGQKINKLTSQTQ